MCSSTPQSLKWLLEKPSGGNVVAMMIGGTAEAFHCKPGQYRLVLNRKGFIKIALKTGSPLVPVFSFGETDLFDQVSNTEGSLLRRFQEWVKKLTGVAPIIPIGRGFLQYTFGFVPVRKPVTTLIGSPLNVTKIEDPTPKEIDSLHERFVNHLTEFFEEHKHNYLENADKVHLAIL
ncbi:hypothetical protein FQA39_LY17794 [Lamprigera yunnana]|nr:hypothetical protein FQA39_LY17794 [Lamprigera yunnana]